MKKSDFAKKVAEDIARDAKAILQKHSKDVSEREAYDAWEKDAVNNPQTPNPYAFVYGYNMAKRIYASKSRNEIINLLKQYSEFLEKEGYTDTDWRTEPPYAIDKFLKIDEPQSGWIKASDRLPAHNVAVLVFIPEEDNHITTGMWDISNKWVLLDEYRVPSSQVTYWHDMIEPPEDKSFKRTHVDETTSDTLRRLQKENLELTHRVEAAFLAGRSKMSWKQFKSETGHKG